MKIKKTSSSTKQFIFLIFLLVLLPILVLAAQVTIKLFGRAEGTPANIVVNASSDLGPLYPFWQAFAQGGEEKGDMLKPVLAELGALSPKYIRLDHIYDAYSLVKKAADGTITYDWSELDSAVSSITRAGAIPLLSLSYMPTELTINDVVGQPRNWQDWENLVTATVEHYSGKGTGQKYLSNVYYEVWNEPDLFGKWKTYGEKNYLDLYSHTVVGAQRAQNVWPFKIGGPATTGLYHDWIVSLLDFVRTNNIRLDFLSYHRYSKDTNDFAKDLNDLAVWLSSYPEYKSLPVIISEWGSDAGNSSWHDEVIDAIHFLASVRQMAQRVELAFSFEIKDGPGQTNKEYWGRWGLLTHEKFGKHKKPKYYSVQFLNNLSGKRLELLGEGSWVTGLATNNNNVYQILLVNYDLNGSHNETVPVSIVNLPSGNYVLKTEKLLGKEKEESFPLLTGRWNTTVYLPAESAVFYTLTKLSDVYKFVPGASGNADDLALSLSLDSQPWILTRDQFNLGQTGSIEFFLKADINTQDQIVFFSLPLGNNQSLSLQKRISGFRNNLEFGIFTNDQETNVVTTSISDWQQQGWRDIKLSWNPSGFTIFVDGKSVKAGSPVNFSYFGDLTFNNFNGAIDNFKISDGNNVILRNFDGDVIK